MARVRVKDKPIKKQELYWADKYTTEVYIKVGGNFWSLSNGSIRDSGLCDLSPYTPDTVLEITV